MILRRTGFTLVELMIVVGIIGILAGFLYPQMAAYYARGRDVQRISDIKFLSADFQNYARTNNIYPSNEEYVGATKNFCISDIMFWSPVITQQDKLFDKLGWTGSLRVDPQSSSSNIWACSKNGSYFYARLQKETAYAVLAARMERQMTGANYSWNLLVPDPGNIDAMLRAQPLDKSGDDENKIFLIITN